MSLWLLLQDAQGGGRALSVERRLTLGPPSQNFDSSLEPDLDDALFRSAQTGGRQAYRLLWREGYVRQTVTARFRLDQPPRNINGHSGDLLFALATLTAALPRRQGYPAIAATGVLDTQGRVGEVEAVPAKLRAALVVLPEGGLVFYPKANRAELDSTLMEAARTQGVELCAVERLDEAAQKLGVAIHKIYLESPYRGLESFEHEHRAIYFGRQADIAALRERLVVRQENKRPGLLIVAGSGAGKSSLVQAGLIPALEEGPLALPDPLLWSVWRPRDAEGRDEAALAHSIRASWAANCLELSALEQTSNLPRLAAALAEASLGKKHLLWLVDQMEELFTLEFSSVAIAAFANFLRLIQETHNGQVWPLATLRNDFYPLYQQQPVLLDVYGATGQYDLLPLDAGALDQVIQGPAELADLSFEAGLGGISLATKIREDLAGRADALPLLEFALKSLYAARDAQGRMNYRSYDANGGLLGSIGQRADILFHSAALDDEARAALPQLLWALTAGGERDRLAAQPAPLAEFAENGPALRLIEAFSAKDARLLVHDASSVRVAHEALLTHWPEAKAIIESFKRDKTLHDRLEIEAERWKAAPPEQSSSRLLHAGLPLSEGEDLLARMGPIFRLHPDVLAYIEASIQWERNRQEAELERERARELAEQERERTERERERLREQEELLAQQKRTRKARVVAGMFLASTVAAGWEWRMANVRESIAKNTQEEAQRGLEEAKRNFSKLQESNRRLLTCQLKIDKELANVSGLQSVRQNNAQETVKQSAEFATTHPGDAEAVIGYAKASSSLSSVLSDIGSISQSIEQMKNAIGLLEKSAADNPDEWHIFLELSKQKLNLAKLYWEVEKRQEAMPYANMAVAELEGLKSAHTSDTEIIFELARAYNLHGNLSREFGYSDAGKVDYENSIKLASNKAMENYADKAELLKILAAAKHNISLIYKNEKNYDKSLQFLDESQRDAADALALTPHRPTLLIDHATGMASKARLLQSMGNTVDARKYWELAILSEKDVVKDNQKVTRFSWLLADSLKDYAGFLSSISEYDASRKAYEEAANILEDITQRVDDRPYYGVAFVEVLDSLAAFHGGGKGNIPRDENSWRKALDTMLDAANRIANQHKNDAKVNFELAQAYARKANFEEETKNDEAAMRYYREALKVYSERSYTESESTTSSDVANFLGFAESAIQTAKRLNQIDEATNIKELAFRIGKSHTTMAGIQSLGGVFGTYGGMLQKAGRNQEAIEAYRKELEFAEPVWKKAEWNWWLRQEVGGAYMHLAELYQKTNNMKEEILARRGWLQVWGGPMHGIETKTYLDNDASLDKPEDVQKLREVTSKDYGMKRFTIPTNFNGIKYPFQVYITNVPWPKDPLEDQARWVEEERGGKIPEEVRESFRKLHKIAHENNVSFIDLAVYAMGMNDKKTDEKENAKVDDETATIIANTVLKEHLNTEHNPAISADSMGLAIRGYDPVAYFTEKNALQGDAKHFAVWNKALWFFASEENRERFIANPTSYAPGFGGYCTYCMSIENGHKFHADPKAWAVHNNKLYLHQSTDYRDKWLKDPDAYIKQAEANWINKAQTKVDQNSDTTVTNQVLALIDKNRNTQPTSSTGDTLTKTSEQKNEKGEDIANTEKDKKQKEFNDTKARPNESGDEYSAY